MRVARVGSWARCVVVLTVVTLVAGLLAACSVAPPAVLEGRVTHAGDGSHPAGVIVRAYSSTAEEVVAQTVTDAEGRFVLRESDLAEGTYRVRFSDDAWWEDASSWADATDVEVAYGSVVVIEVSIVPAVGSLGGTASADDGSGGAGSPASGATVEAVSTVNGSAIDTTNTDAGGGFTFADLPTGDYRVKVSGAPGLAATFHPSSATSTGGLAVTVLAGQITAGVDVVLPAAASLTGTVTNGGAPLAGVTVAATTLAPHETHASVVTGPDGLFALTGLSPTGYLLTLTDPSGSLVVGADPEDPDSGIVYPLAAGGTLEVGEIDFAAGGTTGPVIVTTELPEAVVGMPVLTPVAAVGGAGDLVWEATGLPAGLSLDAATGELSGIPTEAATSSVTLTVTDARSRSATSTLPFDVVAGMPEGCVVSDCALVDVAVGTVELPADAVSGATRNPGGTLLGLVLSPAAPVVTVGQILVVPPGEHTPEGVIVEATDVEVLGDGSQSVTVVRADLTDAYESALIKATEVAPTLSGPLVEAQAEGLSAAAVSCDGAPQVEVSPDIHVDADADVSMLFGRNLFGFGGIFVGTGGLKVFQVSLDTTLTVDLSGRIGGNVRCDVSAPVAFAAVPVGPGAVTFRLEPSFGLEASAAVTLDTSVTLRCSMIYTWSDGNESRSQWCRPQATAPHASGTGADVTVRGGIGVAVTYNEALGIIGQIEADVHASFRPWQRPRGSIDGAVTANIAGCLGCLFGWNLGTVTLWQDDLYRRRVFATWGYDPLPTCGALANSRWQGTYGFDGTTAGTWEAEFGPDGSLQEFRLDLFPDHPEVWDVHLDCQSVSFLGTQGLATWSASFDPARMHLDGTFLIITGGVGHWSGFRT